MKFCDKVAKQRKDNNLSQEQFADRLGVSRQAVSKWESGSSIPDMEKMIQMCSILNCTLEDLLDDGVIKEGPRENSKVNFNRYFQDSLKFITRTYNMFSSMSLKQKLKCLLELGFLAGILLFIGCIIFIILGEITYRLLCVFPYGIMNYIQMIMESIYLVIFMIVGIIIFIHLFKIRYLDYYITIEDNQVEEKTLEKDINYKEIKKERVIIRDPKHSSFSFFELLATLTLYLIKLIVVLCAIFAVMMFIIFIGGLVFSLYHIQYSMLFLYIGLGLIGGIGLALLAICFAYNFVFNRKQPLRVILIGMISSFSLIGIGIGFSSIQILNYEKASFNMVTSTEYIEPRENLFLSSYGYDNITYEIDNKEEKIRLEITYPELFEYEVFESNSNPTDNEVEEYFCHIGIKDMNFREFYQVFMKYLKKDKLVYPDMYHHIKIKVYLSEENYQLLGNPDMF